MSDNMKSLLQFYGIEETWGVVCRSSEYKDDTDISIASLQTIVPFSAEKSLILLVAIPAGNTYERKFPFSKVIEKKYGVWGDLVAERRCQNSYGLIRVGAVRILNSQMPEAVNLMYHLSHSSFLIQIETCASVNLSDRLVDALQKGVLSPQVRIDCCNTTLNYGASFLHIHRGCDGFSINFLSKDIS